MAYATSLSISTGNKVSIDYQSQDLSVSLSYQLERQDTDLTALVAEKAAEVEHLHRLAWQKLRDQRTPQNSKSEAVSQPNGHEANTGETAEQPAPNHSPSPAPRTRAPRATSNGRSKREAVVPPDQQGNGDSALHEPQVQALPCPEPVQAFATSPPVEPASPAQQHAILSLARHASLTDEALSALLSERFAVTTPDLLSRGQAAQFLIELQRSQREKAQALRTV